MPFHLEGGLSALLILGCAIAAHADDAVRQPPAMLSADTPLERIYAYQAYFKDGNKMPEVLWPSQMTAYLWQNMSRVLKTAVIARDGDINTLPVRINPAIGALDFDRKKAGRSTVDDHLDKYPLDAMIVVRKGVIVYERHKTMRPFDKHIWFSCGKVVAGTMIALLEEEGKVDVSAPVSTYLTDLEGSVWDTVPVIDVLDMATGLDSIEHEERLGDARTNPERGWFQWAAAAFSPISSTSARQPSRSCVG